MTLLGKSHHGLMASLEHSMSFRVLARAQPSAVLAIDRSDSSNTSTNAISLLTPIRAKA